MEAEPEPQPSGRKNAPGHPGARIFHLLFKGVALVYYVICEMLFGVSSFTNNFIVLLVFVSADFWTVKNVTGRLLVGLRWWNDVSDDGGGWRFESLEEGQRGVNVTDRFVFWGGLVGNVAAWGLFTLVTMLSPSKWKYLLICVIALIMGGSNTYGYFKCSREAQAAVSSYAQQALIGATTSAVAATMSRPATQT